MTVMPFGTRSRALSDFDSADRQAEPSAIVP